MPPLFFYYCLVCACACVPGVNILPSVTLESSGLYSVRSELNMKVVKENKDDKFYCEVTYLAPGGETRMTETERINITVYCEFRTHPPVTMTM